MLLYGEDEGLVRERAAAVMRAVVGSDDDPFRVAWLGQGSHDRLAEEATAMSLLGGRRVVRVRDAGDGVAAELGRALDAAGDSLIVVEAAALPPRSKLRVLVETAGGAAAIACYPEEGANLGRSIDKSLAAAGMTIEPDARTWLMVRLGHDRAIMQSELEKVSLLCGGSRRIGLEDVEASLSDSGEASADEAIWAAFLGDASSLDRALGISWLGGASPIGLVRNAASMIARLRVARAGLDRGLDLDEAIRAVRPPVFPRRQSAFKDMARRWPEPHLRSASIAARRVELQCKQTGSADRELVEHMLFQAAQWAGSRR